MTYLSQNGEEGTVSLTTDWEIDREARRSKRACKNEREGVEQERRARVQTVGMKGNGRAREIWRGAGRGGH